MNKDLDPLLDFLLCQSKNISISIFKAILQITKNKTIQQKVSVLYFEKSKKNFWLLIFEFEAELQDMDLDLNFN